MNYSYAILKTYVRRSITSVGLDNSIPFLHDLRKNEGLIYDLMELWRTNCDYSVLQTMQEMKGKKKDYYTNFIARGGNDVRLHSPAIDLLISKLKNNLRLDEIIQNTRILARFLLGNSEGLSFDLRPVEVKDLFEKDQVKQTILKKSYRELGMNKSTLWYQKKRLEQTGSIRIYNKTKQYFS